MPHKESIEQNYIFDAYADVVITYEVYPKRTEEGHGFHDFREDEEVDKQLTCFRIKLNNGQEIDITDRLTKEEIQIILDSED